MEWDEGNLVFLPTKALQAQVYDLVKGTDPTAYIHICGGDNRKAKNGETAGVVGWRFGRIRKRLLPPLDGGFFGVELDMSENVFLRARNPWFGDDATRFESSWFVV